MYYDAHRSGRADSADVLLFFNQMDWIAEYEPVAMFDCNNNGRVDFRDVVRFFDRL